MVHCKECGTTLSAIEDVEFVDVESSLGIVRASKRFYVANCAACGSAIGSGVAAKSADGGGAGAAGGAH